MLGASDVDGDSASMCLISYRTEVPPRAGRSYLKSLRVCDGMDKWERASD